MEVSPIVTEAETHPSLLQWKGGRPADIGRVVGWNSIKFRLTLYWSSGKTLQTSPGELKAMLLQRGSLHGVTVFEASRARPPGCRANPQH